MGRAPCCDKANVKRGPWSPEEDAALRSYVERHGTGGNWIALPQKAGLKRCGKSCRLRWLNYLRPDIKHGGFTEEEDSVICTLYKSIGSRWSVIASHLPGRTDNDVKNYWNTKLKKKMMAGQTSLTANIIPPTHIHHCPSPTPPPPPPPPPPASTIIPAIKTETFGFEDFSIPAAQRTVDPVFSFSHGLIPELSQFPMLGLTDEFNASAIAQSVSLDEEFSVASSSVALENSSSSSSNGYFNWTYGGAGADEMLFTDPGCFGSSPSPSSFNELLTGYGSNASLAAMWAASESKPFHSISFS